MKRHISGLHHENRSSDMLEGVFLVRVERAFYRWHPQRPFFALRFAILEPKQLRIERIRKILTKRRRSRDRRGCLRYRCTIAAQEALPCYLASHRASVGQRELCQSQCAVELHFLACVGINPRRQAMVAPSPHAVENDREFLWPNAAGTPFGGTP